MKPSAPTLLFFAVATFLLGAIAYAALAPLEAADRAAGSVNIGPMGAIRLVALVVTIGGPIAFIARALTDHD